MEDITDADYANTKRVGKNFEVKHSGEYHDLHVQKIQYCEQMYLRTSKYVL